jgi:hypothetical protein
MAGMVGGTIVLKAQLKTPTTMSAVFEEIAQGALTSAFITNENCLNIS